jgi:hypothetical protein
MPAVRDHVRTSQLYVNKVRRQGFEAASGQDLLPSGLYPLTAEASSFIPRPSSLHGSFTLFAYGSEPED